MTQETHTRSHQSTVFGDVDTQYMRVTTNHGEQTRAYPQECCFPCAIWALQQHDIATIHSEIGAGKCWKITQHCNSTTERNNELHG
jgi:hypothetical protein